MGKRSRKRASSDAPRKPPAPSLATGTTRGRPVERKASLREAPKPIWSPVPVTELLILIGLVLVFVGFFNESNRAVFLIAGMMTVSVAALELAIREHFAGYRSHSSLLAAVAAVLVAVPLYLTSLPQAALLVTAGVVGALSFQQLRSAFARRAGGLKFRA